MTIWGSIANVSAVSTHLPIPFLLPLGLHPIYPLISRTNSDCIALLHRLLRGEYLTVYCRFSGRQQITYSSGIQCGHYGAPNTQPVNYDLLLCQKWIQLPDRNITHMLTGLRGQQVSVTDHRDTSLSLQMQPRPAKAGSHIFVFD
jgi:hypothetical protein